MTSSGSAAPGWTRVSIYLRVSTDRQDAENQLPELEQLCLARKWSAEVTEETESGAKARPKLDAVCDAACKGYVRAVVIWSLDRLGRDAFEIVARVNRLLAANVKLVSLREPWLEQEGPARQLLLFIFAWVAEQERRRLIERTNAGLDKARAKLAAGGTVGPTGASALGRPRADAAKLDEAAMHIATSEVRKDFGSGLKRGCCNGVRAAALHAGVGYGTLRRYVLGAGGTVAIQRRVLDCEGRRSRGSKKGS